MIFKARGARQAPRLGSGTGRQTTGVRVGTLGSRSPSLRCPAVPGAWCRHAFQSHT